ncbi:MAG: CHAT domain-containing protein [Calothrix sp. MO_167.B12]|nr:CHAT domain-containing protein [Calothrix sp. MO_167.B12]
MNYQDFQILVSENKMIRASSEQGEISGELCLDMDRTKQTLRLIEHQVKDGELLKGLGYELYQALFPNEINARFQATIAGAQANNHSVRLRLIFESPQLAALPWEFLYDKQTNTFLGNNTQTVLSRYIDVPLQKRDIKAASLPLKVLLVISSPSNLAQLDVAGEEKLIREALGKHIEAGDIELDVLREATIRNINQKLREKSYNVFHFIGHGDFKDNKGYIALVDRDSTANLLDDERFANFFLGNNNLGLVILNSCQGATVSSNQAFAGTAPNLVRRGIPAVVAMQYSILDATAKLFADEFYRTLALGYPVDAAIQTTRNAISMEVGLDQRDFATPVLYMRAKDGIILRRKSNPGNLRLQDIVKKLLPNHLETPFDPSPNNPTEQSTQPQKILSNINNKQNTETIRDTVEQQIKFYIYISETKVNMLYSQLILGLNKDSNFEQSMQEKLAVVHHYYTENHKEVGTIKEPKTYISGTLPLRYGIVTEYASDIAYFGSKFDKNTLSLIGASASIIGAVKHINSNHAPFYYTMRFLNQIVNENTTVNKQPAYYSFKEASEIALKCVPREKYNLEFLAKVLYSEPNLIVATPVYVALV